MVNEQLEKIANEVYPEVALLKQVKRGMETRRSLSITMHTRRWSRGARGLRAAVAEDRTPIGAKFRIGVQAQIAKPAETKEMAEACEGRTQTFDS
jgi:hypothetical protein